jgi:hypothetical protein
LFTYTLARRGPMSYTLLGGVSQTRIDIAGQNRVGGLLVPAGGRHAIASNLTRTGVTAGLDLSRAAGKGLRLALPLRVTFTSGRPLEWPGSLDVSAGITLSKRLVRRH